MKSLCASCKHKDACDRDRKIIGYPNYRITECKEYERKGGYRMKRDEIIKWLESLKAEIGKSEHRTLWHYAEAIDMAIEALNRPKGKWISQENDDLKISDYCCSVCGTYRDDIENFCPNCGADMRGEEE